MVKIDHFIRSKRRTILLQIKADGSFVVRAPMRADINKINEFIKKKNEWIITKQSEIKMRFLQRQKMLESQEINSENKVLLLGEKISCSKKRAELILWYKREALKHLTLRVNYFANTFGLKYNSIKISSAKKRWGSCSSRGNINFSWRLIMAPSDVVDYVVAHEVSHLKHRNHSKNFWKHVAMMMPNYKNQHDWLRKNGFLLDVAS